MAGPDHDSRRQPGTPTAATEPADASAARSHERIAGTGEIPAVHDPHDPPPARPASASDRAYGAHPTAQVTTEATFRVDPGEVSRAQTIHGARSTVAMIQDQILAWQSESSLGADFYVYVAQLAKRVDSLDRLLDKPDVAVAVARPEIVDVNTLFQRVSALYRDRGGRTATMIDGATFAAMVIRDAAGTTLTALDETRLISGTYQGVITAIDEYAQGSSPKIVALRAATAAALEAFSPIKNARTLVQELINDAFQAVGQEVSDLLIELTRDPTMSRPAKLALVRRFAAKVPFTLAGSALRAMDAQYGGALTHLEKVLHEAVMALYDHVVDVALGDD